MQSAPQRILGHPGLVRVGWLIWGLPKSLVDKEVSIRNAQGALEEREVHLEGGDWIKPLSPASLLLLQPPPRTPFSLGPRALPVLISGSTLENLRSF